MMTGRRMITVKLSVAIEGGRRADSNRRTNNNNRSQKELQ
jgi:hypothetical protein